MIETVMIFALGFLAASLFALLLLPAVNARAARLSQHRIEARLPLSISEVAAEKDYLRAQFAVAQRRLERKVEAVNAHRHADLAAIGARTLEAAALTRTVESRDATLSEREAVIAATRETLSSVERDLETARQDTALGIATLKVLEEAHRDVLDDLLAAREARMGSPMTVGADEPGTGKRETAEPAIGKPEPESTEPDNTETGVPDLTATLVAERETLRASLAAAEEALAQIMARREGEAADLRRRISDVADSLMQRERLPAATAFTVPAPPN